MTQGFGENVNLYKPFFGSLFWGHNGIDLAMPYGTPIIAPVDMFISGIKMSPNGYGRHIVGTTKLETFLDKKVYYELIFGHLSEILVSVGQWVKQGDIIGKEGNSGFVVSGPTPFWASNPFAGAHLHFGIKRWEQINDSLSTLMFKENAGYIDPIPFFTERPHFHFDKNMFFGIIKNNDVANMQTCMKLEGLADYEPTGNFLMKTLRSVKDYQKKYNIVPALGYCGEKTRQRLKYAY